MLLIYFSGKKKTWARKLVEMSQLLLDLCRVSGAEQEYSLTKAKVKHVYMWSPNGQVTMMC